MSQQDAMACRPSASHVLHEMCVTCSITMDIKAEATTVLIRTGTYTHRTTWQRTTQNVREHANMNVALVLLLCDGGRCVGSCRAVLGVVCVVVRAAVLMFLVLVCYRSHHPRSL